MQYCNEEKKPPLEHIVGIFKEYTTPSRTLRSFTNLSNTVIQTALSGQSKFVFEILQNADDSFEDKHKAIEVQFILQDKYLIVHHNGKGFDFNDVERICDYASQIEEVKATDLSKTGYKGLGFKSLFNLSDCIYIYSNGYSFRFDKTYWPDSQSRPWQVIPIWCRCDELPLTEKYPYDQPVNFILQVNDIIQLENQLKEVMDQPELFLYLYRINKVRITLNEEKHSLERKVEKFGLFSRVDFYKNQHMVSTWLIRTYKRPVPTEVQTFVRGASRFIYPDKIKTSKEVPFSFALRSNETLTEIWKIRGLCYRTLPTQLHLTLPYHINSFFILNLDRTQLHENEWNEFVMYEIGHLQLCLLRDLARVTYLKNYVIELLVRNIDHPYTTFSKAFLKGFIDSKSEIGWLPAYQGSHLLKLGEAWTDEIEFFKQNFSNIRDPKICPYLIHYDVKGQNYLSSSEAEAKIFTYDQLFRDFPTKYYPLLTKDSCIKFIIYLYKRLKDFPSNTRITVKLKNVPFLIAKDGTLLSPRNAFLEESENPVPDFLMLALVDNEYLPANNTHLIKDWLVLLGARWLKSPIQILRESILEWVDSGSLDLKITMKNHIGIMNYLATNADQLTKKETEKLKERLLILTESNKFKLAKSCYLPDAVSIRELADVISNDEKISSSYDVNSLKGFFVHIGVHDRLNPVDVLRKSILTWIMNGEINYKLTKGNYNPIIEFVALYYPAIEHILTEAEKIELKKMRVLTCSQIFQKAEVCYLDSALPNIRGLECIIANNKLVSTENISDNVYKFLTTIGVSKEITPINVIRRSVLSWIQEGDVKKRITIDNHHGILNYIAEQWVTLNNTSGLKPKEKQDLKKIPILTKNNTFKEVCNCYWPASNSSDSYYEEIPGLENIISSDELVSSLYQSKEIKRLLGDLDVHDLKFTDIYEKYSDHLTHHENVKWFFSWLMDYWKRNNIPGKKDKLLSYLQEKFNSSSRLLAKNGKMYYSAEIYSSCFHTIHNIDPTAMPLLDYEMLPEDLERYLGFKTDLDLRCIMQLLKAIHKKPKLGEKDTHSFFTILLEQLRQKDKNEVKKYQLSLFSKDNKLRAAKDLYYFVEKDATCVLDSCYLKRIHNMSHDETLELADLCGVNTLPFEQKVKREKEIYDDTLKKFYLERLPLIVVQESRELNESPSITLKRLYDEICTIKLYQCHHIYVKYPFGNSTEIRNHFDGLTLYVVGKWATWEYKSEIYSHIRKQLSFKTDIAKIIDMEPITQYDKQAWLNYKREDQHKFSLIEEELQKLLSNKEKGFAITPCVSGKIDEPHFFGDKEKHFTDSEFSESEELTSSESSSYESSEDSVEEKHYLETRHASEAENNSERDSFMDGSRAITPYETLTGSMCEDIEVDTASSVFSESKIRPKRRIRQPEIPGSHYSSTGYSSNESSKDLVENESCLKPQCVIEADSYRRHDTFGDEPKDLWNDYGTINDSFGEVTTKIDMPWLVPSESEIEHKNRIQQPELHRNHYATTDFSLGGSSENSVEHKSYPDTQYAFKAGSSGVHSTFINEPKAFTRYETISGSVGDDITKVEKPRLIAADISSTYYSLTESLHVGTCGFLQRANDEEFRIKWLSEQYVFIFLQNYYKNKYRNSQFNLLGGLFTLQWQSHRLKIIWLNESREKGHPYDLLLQKDGEIKRLIEVESTNEVANNDSFHTCHQKFIQKMNQLAAEQPQYKEKYCIYRVFNAENPLVTYSEELCSPSLYKIMLLQNPHI